MDNSQSSDCFLESSMLSSTPMDTLPYEARVSKLKESLQFLEQGTKREDYISSYFSNILEECYTCISEGLDFIIALLSDQEVPIHQLTIYLSDAVSLLQMLSDYIKTVIESLSMTCCSMKTFPTITGQIIMAVFTHCKDSETTYENYLTSVEQILKQLFKNCHELQLTYLMILEKHFIFDLSVIEEKDILLKALEINLEIGEVVQSLDVKTMAEQWKAYTGICEKYSTDLAETSVFQDCTRMLCKLVKINIETATENIQDEKLTTRSLKVASFIIKILIRTCKIFKLAPNKDFGNVIHVLNSLILRGGHLEKSSAHAQFTSLIHANITIPTECLVRELLLEETFVHALLNYDVIKPNDDSLGYILTIILVMKWSSQGNATIPKLSLIKKVYNFLPYCHVWFNLGLLFKSDSNPRMYGLYEHFLLHTAALVCTMRDEEFNSLEKLMIESILSTECNAALFSSNLWVLLSRLNSSLLFNQFMWLCTMYKKLEKHVMFERSPQKIHLTHTISNLFKVMSSEDKTKICRLYRIHEDNVSLWTALRINISPDYSSRENLVAEKLLTKFQAFCGEKGREEICQLIKFMHLSRTCSFKNTRGIEDCAIKMWMKACPKSCVIAQVHNRDTVWFHDYIQALVELTNAVWHKLCERRFNLIKVLHVISSLINGGTVELKLILFDTLCNLATSEISNDKNAESYFIEAFKNLLQDTEKIVKIKFRSCLQNVMGNKNFKRLISNVIKDDIVLQDTWTEIESGKCFVSKDELFKVMDHKFSHKCLHNTTEDYNSMTNLNSSSSVSDIKKANSGNFDFDIDNLFDNESDGEPLSKKIKLNTEEVDLIIKRLEADVDQLHDIKETISVEHKNKIQLICNTLLKTL